MNRDYRYLIEDLCRQCSIDNPGRILGGGALLVNDVSLSLVHREELNPSAVLIYCDLGEIPTGSGVQFFLDLLEANAGLDDGSAFALDDDTGHVLLTAHYPLDQDRSTHQLRDTLLHLATRATTWRQSRPSPRATPPSALRRLSTRPNGAA